MDPHFQHIGANEGSLITNARFLLSLDEESLGEEPSNEKGRCSCSLAARTEQLAATHPDDLLDEEYAELAEHVKMCSACAALLAEYRELDEILNHPPLRKENFIGQVPELPPVLLEYVRSMVDQKNEPGLP